MAYTLASALPARTRSPAGAGDPDTAPPVVAVHSALPVAPSSAYTLPSSLPAKTKDPAPQGPRRWRPPVGTRQTSEPGWPGAAVLVGAMVALDGGGGSVVATVVELAGAAVVEGAALEGGATVTGPASSPSEQAVSAPSATTSVRAGARQARARRIGTRPGCWLGHGQGAIGQAPPPRDGHLRTWRRHDVGPPEPRCGRRQPRCRSSRCPGAAPVGLVAPRRRRLRRARPAAGRPAVAVAACPGLRSSAWAGCAPGMGWMWFLTAPGYVFAVVALRTLPRHGARPWPPAVAGAGSASPPPSRWPRPLRFAFPFEGVPLALAGHRPGRRTAGAARPARRGAAAHAGHRRPRRGAVGRCPRGGGVPVSVLGGATAVLLLAAALAPQGHQVDTIRVALVQGGGPQGTRAIDTDPREVVGAPSGRHQDDRRAPSTWSCGPRT